MESIIFVSMDAIRKIYRFYIDGFREMTIGKTLWTIILCKVFVLFVILKVFFFPNFLKALPDDNAKGAFVAADLEHRLPSAPQAAQASQAPQTAPVAAPLTSPSAPQPFPSGHPKQIDNE